jgi:K+-sensing histidine kinase KdpD
VGCTGFVNARYLIGQMNSHVKFRGTMTTTANSPEAKLLVCTTGRMAGRGTLHSPAADILCVPLQAAHACLGVLALRPKDGQRSPVSQQLKLLESLCKQIALALEVEHLSAECAGPAATASGQAVNEPHPRD